MQTIDGQNIKGPARDMHGEEEAYRRHADDEEEAAFMWPQRTPVDVESMARDAFTRIDDIHMNVMNEWGESAV